MINWQDINDIYETCLNPLIKGSITKLYVEVEGDDFKRFEKNIFGIKALLSHWSHPTPYGMKNLES